MVNTPPTPSFRSSSVSSSMMSIQYDNLFHDGVTPAPPKRESLARSPSMSSPRSHRKDYFDDANTKPAKYQTISRDSVKEYDFNIDRTAYRRLDLKGGVMSLVKGCLGSGSLCIHESYMLCGLWMALPVNVFMGFLLTYSMYMLITAAQKMHVRLEVVSLSYPELAEAALEYGPLERLRKYSRQFRHLVEVFICINFFGGCSVYITIIARQIKQLIEGTEGLSITWPTVRVYIAILLIPCLIICVFTSLEDLAPFSIVLDLFIVLLCVSTMAYAAQAARAGPLAAPVFRSWKGLLQLIGVSLFAMDGTSATLAVESCLQNPRMFPLVLIIGMSIVISLLVIIGSFSSWGFGDHCLAPVTLNFPWGSFSVQLKMFLIIMTYINFALNFWMPSCLVWYYASIHYDTDKRWIWQKVYRTLLVITCNIMSLLLPSIAVYIGLLGSFFVSILGLILPAFIALSVDWSDPGLGKYYWRLWKGIFFILLGVFLCGIGTYFNACEVIDYMSNESNHGGFIA